MPWPGSGKITLRTPRRRRSPRSAASCIRSIWRKSAIGIPPNGFGQKFCTVPGLRRPCSMRQQRGWKLPIGFPPCSAARSSRQSSAAAFVPPDTKRFSTLAGADIPTSSFSKHSILGWSEFADRCLTKFTPWPMPPDACPTHGPSRLGLKAGIPVAVGAFDVHLGAVGSGIAPGTLVKIMGTSTCDLAIVPTERTNCRRAREFAALSTARCCPAFTVWKLVNRRSATFSIGL